MKIKYKVIIFILMIIINFIIISVYDHLNKSIRFSKNNDFYEYYTQIDYLYIDIGVFFNNCYSIEEYLKIKTRESIFNINKKDLLLLNKCENFKKDLLFLEEVKNKKSEMNETDFIFYVTKYYYYINKKNLIEIINKNNFTSDKSKLILKKLNEDKNEEN